MLDCSFAAGHCERHASKLPLESWTMTGGVAHCRALNLILLAWLAHLLGPHESDVFVVPDIEALRQAPDDSSGNQLPLSRADDD